MKILSVDKIREADAYTIKNEPIASIDLMERAANECFIFLKDNILNLKSKNIKIFCGIGNNGGDGLAISRMLIKFRCLNVQIYIIRYSDKYTDDFISNYNRLEKLINIHNINTTSDIPEIIKSDIIIDAIFGSGLSKAITGITAEVISEINNSGAEIFSIDVPSGLFCDISSKEYDKSIINADFTLSFQFPKYSYFFAENHKYFGKWFILPIGISAEFLHNVDTKNFLIEKNEIRSIYIIRNQFSHKGNFGHALLISGSYGKIGAAILASRACLKTGVGLLTTHIPKCGYNIIQTAVPEAMVNIDESEHNFTGISKITDYDAIAIGPGIGTKSETQNSLKLLIQNSSIPLVFDADAINILGMNKTWLSFIPKNSIFTPHPKEFERLTERADNDFHRVELLRQFAIKYSAYVILKGAYTVTATPSGKCFFNPASNPGLATAGSGDVLTGIILSLLAQGYNSYEATVFGVYLHSQSGEAASLTEGYDSMIATDIIDNIKNAYRIILTENELPDYNSPFPRFMK